MSAFAAFAAITAISTGLKMYGQAQQNAQDVTNLRAQASEYRASAAENLAFAREQAGLYMQTGFENARAIEFRGAELLMQEQIAGQRRIGGIRARAGSSGASVNVGTPANVQIAQAFANDYNQRMLDYNTRYESARTRLEAKNKAKMELRRGQLAYTQLMRRAALADQGAGNVAGSRDLQLFNTLLGGGADFGQLYYRFNELEK
tara:strand:+ start:153 stop:764 length:612 start_codon:yes stop_codon:yes gene_type:complete